MGFEDMEVVRKGYLQQRGIGMTAVQVAMEQWEQNIKERTMYKNKGFMELLSTNNNGTFDQAFSRVCKVQFINTDPWDGDIEKKLSTLLDADLQAALTDKEYYYKHDIPLEVGEVVLVPARNVITVAVVSEINCERGNNCSQITKCAMKKVLGLVQISPRLRRHLYELQEKKGCVQERTELQQKLRDLETSIYCNASRRAEIARECKEEENKARALQNDLELHQDRLAYLNRILGA